MEFPRFRVFFDHPIKSIKLLNVTASLLEVLGVANSVLILKTLELDEISQHEKSAKRLLLFSHETSVRAVHTN